MFLNMFLYIFSFYFHNILFQYNLPQLNILSFLLKYNKVLDILSHIHQGLNRTGSVDTREIIVRELQELLGSAGRHDGLLRAEFQVLILMKHGHHTVLIDGCLWQFGISMFSLS